MTDKYSNPFLDSHNLSEDLNSNVIVIRSQPKSCIGNKKEFLLSEIAITRDLDNLKQDTENLLRECFFNRDYKWIEDLTNNYGGYFEDKKGNRVIFTKPAAYVKK